MKQCGSNQWWLDDAKLVIRRQRKAVDILKGVCALALSAGLAWMMQSELGLQGVFYVLAGAGIGLYYSLGAWEVTLHRVSGRAAWRWGLGVPFLSKQKVVAETDRVQLVTAKGEGSGGSRTTSYSVHLAGVSTSETLAGTDDYDEAVALAEAVARHLRRGLQVDDGRVRPFDSKPALAAPVPVEPPSPPPPGCRVQVREQGEQRVVELPAPGWTGAYRFQAGLCAVFMLMPLGFAGYMSRIVSWEVLAMLSPFMLMLLVVAGFFLSETLEGVHATWRISVSRRGLEMKNTAAGEHPATRWAAGLLRDIDVREQVGDKLRMGRYGRP
ncbi:MAG TPA: hypothetical protein VGB96_01830, partial [Archangium sp.]